MAAGAEFGPAKYPMANPMAEKGSDPATRVEINLAVSASGMRTPPKLMPSTIKSETTMALKIMLRIILAAK